MMQICSRCGEPIADRADERPASYLVQEWHGGGNGWLITPQIVRNMERGDIVGLCCASCVNRAIESLSDDTA